MYLDWLTPIYNLPKILIGAVNSIWITIVVFILALFLGTIVGYFRCFKEKKLIYSICTIYVELIRNTPLLVQIFFIYFGLPQFNIYLSPLFAGIIALGINNAAYIAEIVRAGIKSIPKGQWEASKCISISVFDTFVEIIFPQTLRNIFPSLINQFIMILFGTSLLSALDIRELTQVVSILNSQNFRTFELYTFAIVIYYVISITCSKILSVINNKYFPSIQNDKG